MKPAPPASYSNAPVPVDHCLGRPVVVVAGGQVVDLSALLDVEFVDGVDGRARVRDQEDAELKLRLLFAQIDGRVQNDRQRVGVDV